MNIYNKKNILRIKQPHNRRIKNRHMTLDDMVGRYKAFEPINCVELKHKMK